MLTRNAMNATFLEELLNCVPGGRCRAAPLLAQGNTANVTYLDELHIHEMEGKNVKESFFFRVCP